MILLNVVTLLIEEEGVERVRMTLGYWDRGQIRVLVDALRANAVPLAQYWGGDYPPGT